MPVAFLSYAREDLTFDQTLGDLPQVPYTPPCPHPGHHGPLAP
jgi:hypothetical protein